MMWRRLLAGLCGAVLVSCPVWAVESLALNTPWEPALEASQSVSAALPPLEAGATYGLNAGLMTGGLRAGEEVQVTVSVPGVGQFKKTLHDGDPSLYLPFRGGEAAEGATVEAVRSAGGEARPVAVNARLVKLAHPADAVRFEAEPNDTPDQANPLVIGTTIEGSVDDVEYLDNQQEGEIGLDWFRVDIEERCLVIFELDIPDRDVSVNMLMYTRDAEGGIVPYTEGKDPMEIIHDREPERYSKAITRVFEPGTYYLMVNANHPRYQIRTYKYGVPPYEDPETAVEVGLRYAMDVGDAWFAQIPREGNIYQRVQNMHETAMRCTACHPSVFSTQPNLVAHKNGYEIPSKTNFRYVIERIYNSMAPFYGPGDLYWQRFIAIPLQSHGKQGGVLIDFEKQISSRETDIVNRFGPLLLTAWGTRDVLPPDEQNGAVPGDSAFGFAWRDWRVLQDVYRRTGNTAYRDAADNIERIFTSPESEARLGNLQDRMLYVQGLTYMGRSFYRERIDREIDALFELQNPDGGWHEEGKVGEPSAVYATGQMLYIMMEAGRRPEHDPRIEKGLRWLMAQQLPFGGWFQLTHENFRTPMRETRFALMALATGYPKGAPLRGLGNIDGGPGKVPAADAPPGEALLALENILEIEGARQPDAAQAAIALLDRPEPPVRAAAASLLGRIGRDESVEPLLDLLDDPSKLVWREAAWALRQLGNRGHGVEAVKAALSHPDPLVRRGAARIFAYQFQEMDHRHDIARAFIPLLNDEDLLTRLQAIRTLRQWWYRRDDPELRLEIVTAFIDRMGVEGELPVVRTNLAQNMYILLDENQTGGVSIQRNIRDFPPDRAEAVLEARKWVEEHMLLKPVLTAIAEGNPLQREALLESFDGSFFKGRFYARVPRNMIDVGNDREFSFLYEPTPELLATSIGAVVKHEPRPRQRQRGIQLASFFEMPGRMPDTELQLALLANMDAVEPELREVAVDTVRKDLVLHDAADPAIADRLTAAIEQTSSATRTAVLTALARSPEALAHPPVREAVQRLADRVVMDEEATADLVPFVQTDLLDDFQALDILDLSLEALEDAPAAERIAVLDVLAGRAWAPDLDAAEAGPVLPREAVRILQKAATDRDVAVREKVFEHLPQMETLRKSQRATPILFAGLSDESPAIRAKALELARDNEAVWQNPDVHEYVLKLLIDADAKIRRAALDAVTERNLVAAESRYARRVKAVLEGDEALREAAEAAFTTAKLDPGAIEADAQIGALTRPDILFFRDRVNKYLYEKGADQNACANCHANHTILGIAEPPVGRGLTDQEIVNNYQSMLKVINVAEPEDSLVLRKPRSPFGTGNAAADSPTGITHVGGTRWEGDTASEAYQAILAFIRTAQEPEPAVGQTHRADSYSPDYPPALAADGNPSTYWHTEFIGAMPGYPHELVVELDAPQTVSGLTVTPRQDSAQGRVKEFEIYVSADGENWGEPVAQGTWENDALPKTVFIPASRVRFVKLLGLSDVKDQPYMSLAEIELHIDRGRGGPVQRAAR